MQKRNNEMEQRFSLRKYTIGLCSVCLGFVVIGMGSQTVKADTVNDVEKSSAVQENKAQDTDSTNTDALAESKTNASNSATAKPNTTPTETKGNEVGSVDATTPKTADSNNSAAVNTSDQSKSEDSSAVAPTSEKTQLQTSQDSSIKAKENSLNNKSNAMKAVAKFINLNEKNNSSDPNSKDVEVKPKESSNVDTNEQKKVTWHDTFHWVYADKDDPDNPILHKAEDNLAGKKFADDTVVTITFTPKDGKYSTDGIEVSQTGPKLNLTGITDLGATTSATDNKTNHTFRLSFDYNSVPVPQGYDLAHSEYQQTFTLEEGDGKLSHQTPDRETTVAVYKRNSQTLTIKYVDDDENGRNIFDPDTSTVKEGDTVVTNIQDNLKQLENYILVPNQNLPEQITVGNKAIDPIIVHLKHKTEQQEVTKDFVQSASFYLSGLLGAGLFTPQNSPTYGMTVQELFIKGTQKYDLVTRNFIGDATWDYSHIYQAEGDDDKGSTEAKDLDAINNLGDLDKTYIPEGGIYYADSPQYNGQHSEQYKDLRKLMSKAYDTGVISTQTWLKDGLHADGYYLSEKTSLIFDGKSWLNLKEYQEKVDPNFTWTTTSSPEVMQGDHAVDHINPEKLTLDLLPKLDSELNSGATGIGGGREIFLNYVPYTYKHHSAQRTINIHLPNGEVKTVSQKADAKQPVFTVYTFPDARNDKLASQETGNWTGGEWAEYDAPVVAGYTASQPTVSAKAVTGDTQNETIDITYVASEHTSHVKLVDNDNKTIQDTPVMGKTGETANVSVTVPKGWQLTQGQELPTQISFNAEGHPDVVVQIEHKTIKVTPDNPKENGTVLPDNPSLHFNGVSHDDLNKTVTREVTITDPTGKKSTTTQTVTFTRGATVDEVTNKVTYDDWSENGKHTFDKVDVSTVSGYTASREVPEVVVTPQTQSSKVNITYTPKEYTVYIFYGYGSDTPWTHRTTEHSDYPDDFDKWANGKRGLAKPEILTGHYGESISIPIKKITGYHVDPEADYTKYKFGIDSITGQELNWFGRDEKDLVDPVDPSDPNYEFSTPRYIVVQYVKDSTTNGYNIAYVDTYGAVINRPDNLRGVSGEATNYTAPEINGYTLTNPQDVPINFGDGTKDIFLVYKPQDVKVTYHYVDEKGKELAPSVVENNHFTGLTKVDENTKQIDGYSLVSTPKQRVVEDLKDLDLSFVYTANNGTQTIVYQDEDGSEVGKQVVPGKTDETVKVTPDVPDGYVVKGEIPSEVTIKPDDTPITVTVEHGKSHVTPDKPVNKGDLIPDTKDKHYPEGLTHDDLNKTVTREITITDPSGKKTTTTQTVTFTRGATVDEVTNKVTYDDWSENGKHTFDKADVPNVPGYTASGEVPSIVVTPETQSSKVDITYTANDGTQTIVYQDEDGSEVGKEANGKEPEKPNKSGNSTSKTPEKPNKSGKEVSKTSEKPNKSGKEVSKQFGKIAKTTIPEKHIDSRTVDNHVSAKSTAKRELPQTGATTNTGIWTGLVSMIASLGLLGASRKRKKN